MRDILWYGETTSYWLDDDHYAMEQVVAERARRRKQALQLVEHGSKYSRIFVGRDQRCRDRQSD